MFNLNALFCLDCLVQALVIASAEHDTAGKFINNKHLIVFNNIVNVSLHNADCLDCLVDVVLNCHVFGVHEVIKIKIFLRLFNAGFCKGCGSCFFINNKVAVRNVL